LPYPNWFIQGLKIALVSLFFRGILRFQGIRKRLCNNQLLRLWLFEKKLDLTIAFCTYLFLHFQHRCCPPRKWLACFFLHFSQSIWAITFNCIGILFHWSFRSFLLFRLDLLGLCFRLFEKKILCQSLRRRFHLLLCRFWNRYRF